LLKPHPPRLFLLIARQAGQLQQVFQQQAAFLQIASASKKPSQVGSTSFSPLSHALYRRSSARCSPRPRR
jgi:hypothetical protein